MSDLKISNDKHFFNVIKNSGPSNGILFREPIEQFNNGSTLIVNPSECALFISEGKIVGEFKEGSYKLDTKNIPILSGLKAIILSGGISKYTAQIYYIRLSETPEIKFGTSSPIMVRDNKWGIVVPIRLYGIFKINVVNPKTFFEKINFGNTSLITDSTIKDYINESIQQVIRKSVTDYLKPYSDELIGIESQTTKISDIIQNNVAALLLNYGLNLAFFKIISLNIELEKYNQIDQAKIQSISRKIDAQTSKEIFEILGEDWERQKQVEILEKSASNNESGGVLSAIYLADKMKSSNENKSETKDDVVVKLQNLKELLDKGILEEDEYKELKKKILEKYL